MELNKFNAILTEKPKIINTLNTFCCAEPSNLAILNEYRPQKALPYKVSFEFRFVFLTILIIFQYFNDF